MNSIDDLKEFDTFLRFQCGVVRNKLRDMLVGKSLTLREARRHKVLIPMIGVYTPGWQALPACSWEFIELVTNEGLVGTGEWSIRPDQPALDALELLKEHPNKNLLDDDLEIPLFMAWWDLVGKVLGKPLHQLWAELFDVGFEPPTSVPLAAYTWQRFPDAMGQGAVTFESWPQFAREQAEAGFKTIKISMTGYEPDDYIDLLTRIREALPDGVDIRVDAHGTWNFVEARRIIPKLAGLNISYIEQPINAMMPERFYPHGELPPQPARSYQRDYYFRKLEELRHHTAIPFSCHWWTPPIVQPPGSNRMSNQWVFDWHMIERFDPVDISAPDIGLGVFGLWRLLQMTRFMGLHIMLHSNFELGLQSTFRAAMNSALAYYPEGAGLYLGTPPRLCLPMDTEYNQVSDDVLVGGKVPLAGGAIALNPRAGHGLGLDPERLEQYRYSEDAVRPHREYSTRLYNNYVLDRPRRRTMSGWPKQPGAERVERRAYPYDLTNILGIQEKQEVDVELNT